MAALTRKDKDDDKTAGSGAERTGRGVGSAETEARSEQGPPEPPASSFVVKVEDHEIKDVDVTDGPGSIDDDEGPRSIENISAENFSKLYRAMLDENARRGMLPQNRPFADIDKESLLILQNQLRGELASR